jgi:zinc D-Ala-D-Ala carboxypeptidase
LGSEPVPHFTLAELTRTSTPYANVPAQRHIDALRALCVHVLEPLRVWTGALRVTSGYRSPTVNAAVNGSPSSQHIRGEAADVQPLKLPLEDAWRHVVRMVESGELPVDQGIFYVRAPGSGWMHLSHAGSLPPRRQLLVQVPGHAYVPWHVYQSSSLSLVLS